MRIDILTVVPELLESPLGHSIVKRACDKGLVEIHVHNIREWGLGRWRQVDDYSFGGDAGMVMMIEPVFKLMEKLKAERSYDEIIFTAPDGEPFTQTVANELSCLQNILILCGHYKGVDHRIREHLVTREITVGDYVLSGGELPAAIITDAVVRLLPGALGVYNMIVARTFFTTNIPQELMEAAKLDGCGNTRFFINIVLPLSGSIIAILFLYYGVGHWNSYFSALLYITDRAKFPLQLELRNILLQNSVNMSSRVLTEAELAEKERLEALKEMMKYSLIIISSIPVLIIYPFVQKHFVKGVMIGSVKG